jgi:hypothetical protein
MSKQVEFFFDYGSPFSYLADTQLPAIAQRTDVLCRCGDVLGERSPLVCRRSAEAGRLLRVSEVFTLAAQSWVAGSSFGRMREERY